MFIVPSDLFQVQDSYTLSKEIGYQSLVDNGSQVTTTNHRFLLHDFEKISFQKYLRDAGKRITYKVEGKGFLFVPRGDGSYIKIPCWYTPSMPVTDISPGEVVSAKKDVWKAHTIFSHHFKGSGEVRFHGKKHSQ